MKKIEWLWNLIYYKLYLLDVNLSQFFNFINPVYWLNRIPRVQRHHHKQNVEDFNEFAKQIFNNPKNGLSSIWAGAFMGGLLVLIFYGLFNIFQGILSLPLIQDIWKNSLYLIIFIGILLTPIILINNYLLFRKHKFLNYFKEFEKMDQNKRSTYNWLSFFVIISIVLFFVSSFYIL